MCRVYIQYYTSVHSSNRLVYLVYSSSPEAFGTLLEYRGERCRNQVTPTGHTKHPVLRTHRGREGVICHTRRFAPWAAYAACYACSERKIVWSRQRSTIDCKQVQTGDLKMTRAPPCTWYIFLCICDVRICLSQSLCDYRAFVARMTNRHGHWVCWTTTAAVCGACWMSMWKKQL